MPARRTACILAFFKDQVGATAIEYGLIAALGRDHRSSHGCWNATRHDLQLGQHRSLRCQQLREPGTPAADARGKACRREKAPPESDSSHYGPRDGGVAPRLFWPLVDFRKGLACGSFPRQRQGDKPPRLRVRLIGNSSFEGAKLDRVQRYNDRRRDSTNASRDHRSRELRPLAIADRARPARPARALTIRNRLSLSTRVNAPRNDSEDILERVEPFPKQDHTI